MKRTNHILPSIRYRKGDPGFSRWTEYDPSWLEAEEAYHRHSGRFPASPAKPRIINYPCRDAFLMPVTVEDVSQTLDRIPVGFLAGLQAVFLLAGTRKQERCAWGNTFSYGCYWSDCVFLHPYPKSMLRSVYPRPPKPSELIDYTRVGAEITTDSDGTAVQFSPASLKKLYLHDVLIHEIGHHVDKANLGNTNANEAFAKWFATEFGFRQHIAVSGKN